jgi:cytochrome c oxidase subunit 2
VRRVLRRVARHHALPGHRARAGPIRRLARQPEAARPHGDRRQALSGSSEFEANPLGAWQQRQEVEAGEDPALVARGRKLFTDKTCISCHTIRGHEGIGITGPDLTRVGARSTIAAGVLENTPERMSQWLHDPNHFKPGNKMYFGGYFVQSPNLEWKRNFTLTDPEIGALVAYLHSLK